jgi:hypothetical protein
MNAPWRERGGLHMSKIIIVKKAGNVSSPMPCPYMVDMPAEGKR